MSIRLISYNTEVDEKHYRYPRCLTEQCSSMAWIQGVDREVTESLMAQTLMRFGVSVLVILKGKRQKRTKSLFKVLPSTELASLVEGSELPTLHSINR